MSVRCRTPIALGDNAYQNVIKRFATMLTIVDWGVNYNVSKLSFTYEYVCQNFERNKNGQLFWSFPLIICLHHAQSVSDYVFFVFCFLFFSPVLCLSPTVDVIIMNC